MTNFESTGEALPEFYIGKKVKVQRGTPENPGPIEEGWEIVEIVPATETQSARIKLSNGLGDTKSPRIETLRSWNN